MPFGACMRASGDQLPDLAAEALGEPGPLTDRERQVLRLGWRWGDERERSRSGRGCRMAPCATISSEAIGKLGAANRVDASRIARAKGWL